ncbi:MAG: CO dehydrogenase/acetyl-CoA synthase complex subunit epsilon [Candidatus Alkanophagales archaeon]|nr:MAG: CO dehydrogenase/acetyl-CoA synthase complex subunit epsilon [Candidatus Alkanophagales archaeon]
MVGIKGGPFNARLKSLRTPSLNLSDLEIIVGRVKAPEEAVEGEEPIGPTPMPSIKDLRYWDEILLRRYKPFYSPICDMCCFCVFGKCDLTGNKRGVCGIDIKAQQGRWSLLTAVTGLSTHYSHAKELVEWLIETKGPDVPIDLGEKTPVEAPITRVITGITPKKLSDFEPVLDYIGRQIGDLVASIHIGQESDAFDFESKALHAGMLDALSMEIADIAQICALDLPKGDIEPPLVEIGVGTVDIKKPVILCIGHNIAPGSEILNYLEEKGLADAVEVCALCCTAHDMSRYRSKIAKIVGQISMQKKFVRSGFADVVIIDEQCIYTDLQEEARKVKAPVIVTSPKAMRGFPDRTNAPTDEIVKELLDGVPGVLILDPEKVGEVAVRVAMELAPRRRKYKELPDVEAIIRLAKYCKHCKACERACPNSLKISDAMYAAADGDLSKLVELEDKCFGCGKCESECSRDIPVLSMIVKAAERQLKEDRSKIRAGRGPITDYEMRMVADTWGSGITPGCIALVGCANYPGSDREVYEMAKEFLERGYIVVATGCAAMAIARYKDEEGKSLYETHHGIFDAGGMLNIGSCVSNSHIIAAGIRLAVVFSRRIMRGNFAELADYWLSRTGACGIVWGTMSQKAYSIASACNRFGIPVILGPHGSKYRRLYLGNRDELTPMYHVKTGERRDEILVPEHLLYVAESKEEAIVTAIKLCMRYNDFAAGRKAKIMHYVDAYFKYFGRMPEDLKYFVRNEEDIPSEMREVVLEELKREGWQPKEGITWQELVDISTLEKEKIWTFEAMRRGLRWFTV